MALQWQRHRLKAVAIIAVAALFGSSCGLQYWVGDSVWSIPPYPNFYNDWSSTHLFQVGDSLVFEFESEFYNLMQVTTLDYQNCKADNPIKVLKAGPAIIPLNEPGVFYYLCSLSNYCDLGQKMSIIVHHRNFPPAPAPAPVPVPVPVPVALAYPPQPFASPSPQPSQADRILPEPPTPVTSESPAPHPTADLGRSNSCNDTSTSTITIFQYFTLVAFLHFICI